MQEYQQWFNAVDKDRSGSISAQELMLLAFGGKPLGLETAKKLISVFDRDKSATIDINEYAVLHKFLTAMQNAFFAADKDRNGTLDAQEIYTAVVSAGFTLQFNALQAFYRKYTVGKPGMDFVSFISMITTIALVRVSYTPPSSSLSLCVYVRSLLIFLRRRVCRASSNGQIQMRAARWRSHSISL